MFIESQFNALEEPLSAVTVKIIKHLKKYLIQKYLFMKGCG